MRVVYVAGPFTADNAFDVAENVLAAERVGRAIAARGAMPLIPHANTRHFIGLGTPAFWYEGTLELLRRCDAIAMVPGWLDSKGACAEHAEALMRGMPIFDFGNGEEDAHGDLARWTGTALRTHVYNTGERYCTACGADSWKAIGAAAICPRP